LAVMGRKKEEPKMFTIKKAAELIGASASSIRVWLSNDDERKRRFPGAVLVEPSDDTPGVPYWLIPEGDINTFELGKRGPKPGAKKKAQNN
jgi:hypothetical protein